MQGLIYFDTQKTLYKSFICAKGQFMRKNHSVTVEMSKGIFITLTGLSLVLIRDFLLSVKKVMQSNSEIQCLADHFSQTVTELNTLY